jgi:hypothetical protein
MNNNNEVVVGEDPGESWMITLLKTFNPVWEEEGKLVALTMVIRSTSGTTPIFDLVLKGVKG